MAYYHAKLRKSIEDDNGQVAGEAAESLVGLGPVVIPKITKLLESEDCQTRYYASGILCRIGKPALPVLKPLLNHGDHHVRQHAAFALGWMARSFVRFPPGVGGECHVLISNLNVSNPILIPLIPNLIDMLDDPHLCVRKAAASAIFSIGSYPSSLTSRLQEIEREHYGILRRPH